MSAFRTLLWWLLLAALGALAYELLARDLGEVVLRWHGFTLTTTVAFALLAWALGPDSLDRVVLGSQVAHRGLEEFLQSRLTPYRRQLRDLRPVVQPGLENAADDRQVEFARAQ